MMADATSESKKEVTVLGAGIVGVCCALSLMENGFKVTLIDRNEPGEETSHGNAGVISPWSCVPQCLPGVWKSVPKWVLDKDGPVTFRWRYLPTLLPWAMQFFKNANLQRVNQIADAMDLLMADNIATYRKHLQDTGQDGLLVDSLYVNVFKENTQPDLEDLPWKLRLDRGAPVEIIGQGELRALEPALSREYQGAVIIKDQARAASPGKLCKALAEKAIKNGAAFSRMKIEALARADDGTITLLAKGQTHHCQKLILAGGFGSMELLKPLGIRLPLISERGYHAEFTDPSLRLNNSILDVAGKFVVSSMTDGLRAAGTTEFAHPETPADYKRSKSLEGLAKGMLPDLQHGKIRHWMGVRPSLPDSLPVIGAIDAHPNIIAAFGHGHYGMGMAPATGRIVASLVSGQSTNQDMDAVRPDRFSSC